MTTLTQANGSDERTALGQVELEAVTGHTGRYAIAGIGCENDGYHTHYLAAGSRYEICVSAGVAGIREVSGPRRWMQDGHEYRLTMARGVAASSLPLEGGGRYDLEDGVTYLLVPGRAGRPTWTLTR